MRFAITIALFFGSPLTAMAQSSCSPVDPGSPDAEACAAAIARAADDAAAPFLSFWFTPIQGIDLRSEITQLRTELGEATARVEQLAHAYEAVFAWGSRGASVDALIAQGRLYQHLRHAVLFAAEHRDPALATSLRSALEPQLRPTLCLALVRYVLATRAARPASLVTPSIVNASAELRRWGVATTFRCVAEQRERDATVDPYSQVEHDTLVRLPGDRYDLLAETR